MYNIKASTLIGRHNNWCSMYPPDNSYQERMKQITPTQEQKIILAGGCICEWCAERVDPSHLRILWSPDIAHQDLQCSFLVLCPSCHRILQNHRLPPALHMHITGRRPYHLRRAIRRILLIQLPPYQAPDTFDLADLYRDACSSWCLNGSG